jgi:hypothetical protein
MVTCRLTEPPASVIAEPSLTGSENNRASTGAPGAYPQPEAVIV